jgi:hypothetical protein
LSTDKDFFMCGGMKDGGVRLVVVAGEGMRARLRAGSLASVYGTLLPWVQELSFALLTVRRDCTILVANAAKRPDAARTLPRIPSVLPDGRHTLLAASLQVFSVPSTRLGSPVSRRKEDVRGSHPVGQ